MAAADTKTRRRAAEKTQATCSVVVPSIQGREHWLEQCVAAYEATTPGVEIIVVMDKESCGVAWEEGVKQATGRYVHLTADDLTPLPGWFEAAQAIADQGAIPIAHVLSATGPDGDWLEASVMTTQSYLLGDRMVPNVLVPFFSRQLFDDVEDGDSWIVPIHYGSDDWVTFLADRRGVATVPTPGYRFGHGAAAEGRLHSSRVVDLPILCERMAKWGPVPAAYRDMGLANGWTGETASRAVAARGPAPRPEPVMNLDDGYYWNGPTLPGQPAPLPPHRQVARPGPVQIASSDRLGPPVVWSCSQFNNELDVLEIRLGTIGHLVDRIVLAEATVDQRGRPKEVILGDALQTPRFAEWRDKITYLVVDDMPVGNDPATTWLRERWQRDALLRGMGDLRADDLVLVSDLDEIPSPEALADACQPGRPPVRFMMDLHVYRLNWRWLDRNEQIATLASVHLGADFLAAGSINDVVLSGPFDLRPDSGWHLTYQGDVERLRAKMTGMADAFYEDLVPEAAKYGVNGPDDFLTDEWILGSIETGRDIYARDYRRTEWVDLDALPPYVQEHPERFAHMLIARPVLEEAAA